jgi:TonB family protein
MLNELKKAVWVGALLFTACVGAGAPLHAEEQARKIITRVAPTYPALARSARLSGAVKLLAVVTPEGTVKSVRTLGGSPIFVPAAEDAVKQWRYEASKKETIEPVALTFSSAE